MATQLLAGRELARKCASAANISPKSAKVKRDQAEKLELLGALLLAESIISSWLCAVSHETMDAALHAFDLRRA